MSKLSKEQQIENLENKVSQLQEQIDVSPEEKSKKAYQETLNDVKKLMASTPCAFPSMVKVPGHNEYVTTLGMKTNEYAAIHLGLPISGNYNLDIQIYNKMVFEASLSSLSTYSIEYIEEVLEEIGFKRPQPPQESSSEDLKVEK